MSSSSLRTVAEQVVRRAQQQGHVLAREVREELARAGLEEALWKDVLALALASLSYRRGRYYYVAPSARVQAETAQQRDIHAAVRRLIDQHSSAGAPVERRGQDRVDFIQPVTVITEDQRRFTLLSRDLSATGIRLVGTRRLLGQKVRVLIPTANGQAPYEFLARILWTCPLGDDLVENGGQFLAVESSSGDQKTSAN
jgi:hypothetical protein